MLSSSEDKTLADLSSTTFNEKAKTRLEHLPPSSKEIYIKAYHKFIDWKNEKNLESFSESVFLTYFNELSKKMQPSSLWPIYSILKTTVSVNHNVNIQKFESVTTLIKNLMSGYISKKSEVFTPHDVETFLQEAPDEIYLATKVSLIFGISGACTSLDLVSITVDDVEKLDKLLLVKLPNSYKKIERTFVIRSEFIETVKKYEALRPKNVKTNRYFLNYLRGKCTNQVIGKNKFSSMPKEIARYLKLPNPAMYTGYCFRKTSANLIADSGASLRRRAGWRVKMNTENYNGSSVETTNNSSPSPTLRNSNLANMDRQLSIEKKTKAIRMQQCPLDSQATEMPTGFKCRSCEDEIFGFRYVCVECAEYNICINCEALSDHPTHYMLRIPVGKSQAEAKTVLERIRKELIFQQTNTDSIQEQRDSIVPGHGDYCKQEEITGKLLIDVIKHEIVEDRHCSLPADYDSETEQDSIPGDVTSHTQPRSEVSELRIVSKRKHKNKISMNIDCVKPRPTSALTTENEDTSPMEKKIKIEIQLEEGNEVDNEDYFNNILHFAEQSTSAENVNFTPSSGSLSEDSKIIELKLDKCLDTT